MKKLPHGLMQLTNLEKLSLEGIEKKGGEDWNKLRNITR